jgi:hypothetical protein
LGEEKNMKKIAIVFAVLCAASLGAQARGGGGHSGSHASGSSSSGYTGSHSTSSYTRGNGTYVAPSHATNPNSTKADNWTTKGNVNPYTGKAGTK